MHHERMRKGLHRPSYCAPWAYLGDLWSANGKSQISRKGSKFAFIINKYWTPYQPCFMTCDAWYSFLFVWLLEPWQRRGSSLLSKNGKQVDKFHVWAKSALEKLQQFWMKWTKSVAKNPSFDKNYSVIFSKNMAKLFQAAAQERRFTAQHTFVPTFIIFRVHIRFWGSICRQKVFPT